MASLNRALLVATACPRWRPAQRLGLQALAGAAGPKAEKNVPYQRTLKEEAQGPGAASRGPSQPLPSTASVVVIGGGSVGCQTLYHLAKLGVAGAVLLERERLTSGTTWHTAGLLWQLRPSDVEVELLAHTRRVVSRDLEEETGMHTGWIQNGGLFIASSRQRLDEYKRLMSLGKAYGVESHVLSPAETKVLYPLMKVDDLYGTLYVPQDGTMDPAGTCSTLARAAVARGARVIENCTVTGIRVRTDDFGVRRVAAVETEHGSIQTPCVVNCAGVWAGAVGRMAGVKVPLVAMHHAYVVTERIEGIQNMPNVRDHDASVYLRLQGDALSVGGYEANPIFWEEVSDKFTFGLFDLDWDVFTQHIEGAINRVPVLETTGIKSTVCGPESFTPDHKPLMGEAPELRGFFLGCGFNSAGMMLGGGCGQELAHWVVHGRPEKDMYSYDIRRFHPSLTAHQRWVRERSHESYAKNYAVVFPHDEPLAGRNMRRSLLHEELLGQGCVFQERHGWERPGWFSPQGPAPVLEYDYYGAYRKRPHRDYAYARLLADEYTFSFPPQHHVGAEAPTQHQGPGRRGAPRSVLVPGNSGHPGPVAEKMSVSPGNRPRFPSPGHASSHAGCDVAALEGKVPSVPTLSPRLAPWLQSARVRETEAEALCLVSAAAVQGGPGCVWHLSSRCSESCAAPALRGAEARGRRQLGTGVSQPPQMCPRQPPARGARSLSVLAASPACRRRRQSQGWSAAQRAAVGPPAPGTRWVLGKGCQCLEGGCRGARAWASEGPRPGGCVHQLPGVGRPLAPPI